MNGLPWIGPFSECGLDGANKCSTESLPQPRTGKL